MFDNHNSLVVKTWANIAADSITHADRATFLKRFSKTFLTIELPSLGKALEEGLSSYVLDISLLRFKTKKGTVLPLFLYDLFSKVFDDEGYLKWDDNVPVAIKHIRQLTLIFYKFELEFDDKQREVADHKFRATDESVKTEFTVDQINDIRSDFLSLLPNIDGDLVPRHGSGATVECSKNHEKVSVNTFPLSLLRSSVCSVKKSTRCSTNDQVLINTPSARLVHIPKDSRGPRSIALQPTVMMKYQLPLMSLIYEYIENASPARGFINFTDQQINVDLAYLASNTGEYATIDLKDASDLVSNNLIELLTEGNEWNDHLFATRCTHCTLDNGEEILLNKFASMGSALCFPIEAALFWSVARTVCKTVYVYGDDIIVPNQFYGDVCSKLEDYGLIVNRAKSLHTGFFRESCGGEFYQGHDISVVKLRKTNHLSWVAFFSELERKGVLTNEKCTSLLREYNVELGQSVLFQQVSRDAEAVRPSTFITNDFSRCHVRWNKNYHYYEARVILPTPDILEKPKTGYSGIDSEAYYDNWLLRKAETRDAPLDFLTNSSVNFAQKAQPKYGWIEARVFR